jgi:hypothetical protein
LIDAQRHAGDDGGSGRGAEFFSSSGISLEPSAAWRARASVQRKAENCVAAFIAAIADDVFPVFLVIVGLFLGPGLTGGKIDGLGLAGPGEGVDLVFTRGDGKGLAAVGRDEKELG